MRTDEGDAAGSGGFFQVGRGDRLGRGYIEHRL